MTTDRGPNQPENCLPEPKLALRERRKRHLIVFGAVIGLIVFLEILGWLHGGGLASIVSAAQNMERRSQLVDVDSSALRWPIMIGLASAAWLVASVVRVDVRPRLGGVVLVLIVFGGGFFLDGFVAPPITAKFMASKGYGRCPARDHHVGNGKSRVWFDSYARSEEACATGPARG